MANYLTQRRRDSQSLFSLRPSAALSGKVAQPGDDFANSPGAAVLSRSTFDPPMTPKILKVHRTFNPLRLGQPRSVLVAAGSRLQLACWKAYCYGCLPRAGLRP
jgi:hypothetical protein